jgi:ATP-dependent helicase HrpA
MSSEPAAEQSSESSRPAPGANDLLKRLDDAMISDRHRLRRQLQDGRKGEPISPEQLDRVRQSIESSVVRADERRLCHPAFDGKDRLRFDESLPIVERIDEIAAAIERHPVIVVAGETGSGKSTQIPKICLKLGRGVHGLIGHTQPRRIAARSIATRLAEELRTPIGEGVGYKMRFADAMSPRTHIKVMTDGILLAEIQSDRFLDAYDTLIIDEAHERSLNIDLILGYLHRLIRRRRDLKVIITSATIDADRFAAYFDSPDGVVPDRDESEPVTAALSEHQSPIIEVSGRTYPVEVRYRPVDDESADESIPAAIASAVEELQLEAPGDTLVFLPTEREIREAAEVLRGRMHGGSRRSVDILPLYGRLSERDQQKVFQNHSQPRVILATNVAESSLTVPGVRYVVDTGTARISRFTPQAKVQRLPIEPISRASADQRKGRCGRTAPGICIRLYSPKDYADREAYTPPEILRTNLAAAVLQTLTSGIGELASLPLLDRPQPGAIRSGYATLHEIGAIHETPQGWKLTERGRTLAKWPVDPRIGRMILAGHEEHCLADVLVIAAALEVRDPRDRPVERQQAADEAHKQFAIEGSDFLTLLKIWNTFQDWTDKLSNSQLRKACQQNFLSFARMREWRDLHRQLARLVGTAGLKPGAKHNDADALHRALLTGLLSNIAIRGETTEYTGASDQLLHLWPGSAAFSKKPKWIVAAELVETSRRFARTVGPINPEWIEKIAGELVKKSHIDPQWDRKMGAATAFERVTLYGLPVVARRRCQLSAYDAPKARELFIQNALVESDYETRAKYHQHNLQLKEDLKDWQAKLRKTQLFASEELQFQFFDRLLPADVVDSRSFERWRKDAEKTTPEILYLSKADLLVDPDLEVSATHFPDMLRVGGVEAAIEYRLDPSVASDGLTLVVPAAAVQQLDPARLGWLVPGMLEEKVESLLKSLPRELRRLFLPINETARAVVGRLSFGEGSLPEQVSGILRQLFNEHVPVEAFEAERLPSHLNFKIRAVDSAGETVAADSDVVQLQKRLRNDTANSFSEAVKRETRWTIDGLKSWNFGDLPECVEVEVSGQKLIAHPMLIDQGNAVGLRLTDDPRIAERESRRGLTRLFRIVADAKITQQVAYLPKFETWAAQAGSIIKAVDTLSGATSAPSTSRALAEEVRRQLSLRVAERATGLSKEMPRSEAEFKKWLKISEGRISVSVQDITAMLEPVLTQGRDVQKLITGPPREAIEHARHDIQTQWTTLFDTGFLAETSWESLLSYPRYLEAILIRWKKLQAGGLARDRELTSTINFFWTRYLDIRHKKPTASPYFEAVRWLIEEYRVSLFAQQLRTATPVSDKRIREAWSEAAKAAR